MPQPIGYSFQWDRVKRYADPAFRHRPAPGLVLLGSAARPILLAGMATSGESFEFDVVATTDLRESTLTRAVALFRSSYRAASDVYLMQSLARIRFIATATSADTLAGFALGEMRLMDLPRLPLQPVALAGICCVDPRFRRRGLFRELEWRAFMAAGIPLRPRVLSCGRMAHPASFRTMTWNPSHVPKPHTPPTTWQREIGAIIAKAYGAKGFDPDTFVCIGGGTPMHALIEMDVGAEEWEVFAAVNRDRGDSLLGLCWMPDAPAGW